MPRGSQTSQYKDPPSVNPLCGTPGVNRRYPYREPDSFPIWHQRQADVIPAYPPPRPKIAAIFNEERQCAKSTEDTDDGYDECQSSDDSSEIDRNNVVGIYKHQGAESLANYYIASTDSHEIE